MGQPLKRYGTVEIAKVYKTPADITRLAMDWQAVVKRGGTFCPDGACPFVPGEKFDYDLTNFLYYRARAITADIMNLNGDLFPHLELKAAYPTFTGKGVYFNHDSANPEKAFGIILDSVYTPVLFNKDDYEDKYIELLCAIDRKAINAMRPGLLGDIESGKVTSTSMGTIAQEAKCSVCGNLATNMDQLCLHVHPQSPLYSKGRDVYGKKCYETNYKLSFIEDSIVYIPADATARMLEVYASAHTTSINRMAELFEKYAVASGRPVARPRIELSQNFLSTGGFMPQATAGTPDDAQELQDLQATFPVGAVVECTDGRERGITGTVTGPIRKTPTGAHMAEWDISLQQEHYSYDVSKPQPMIVELMRKVSKFMPTSAPKPQQPAIPGAPAAAPYQEALGNVTQQVGDSTEKLIETKIRRVIEEELRKVFAPMLESMDKSIRPEIKTRVEDEFNKVKGEVGAAVPAVANAPVGPAAAAEEDKKAPAAPAAPAAQPPAGEEPLPRGEEEPMPVSAAMQYPISFVENFAEWKPEDKAKIVQAIKTGKTFEFKGMLEFPVKEA